MGKYRERKREREKGETERESKKSTHQRKTTYHMGQGTTMCKTELN
jgi:hypothetical protein